MGFSLSSISRSCLVATIDLSLDQQYKVAVLTNVLRHNYVLSLYTKPEYGGPIIQLALEIPDPH